MNVLEIVQRFTNAVGLPEPNVAVANQSDDVIQIVELLNQEGRELSRRADWQEITFEQTFTTVAAASQGLLSSIITNGHQVRKIVNETIFNRTTKLPVYGPISRREWQARQALSLTGPVSQYRIRGNYLLFNPAPASGDTCAFEFVSKCWCSNAAATSFYTNVQADTDLVLLDDEIMLAGIEWRWLRKKGLSYAEEFASYEAMVKKAKGDNGSKRTLNMADDSLDYRPAIVIPIGSWDLP